MSDPTIEENKGPEMRPEERSTALFANLVIQLANTAMMLMGQTPHPETGESMRDLEAAQLFIDQLEMLEAKTKGNLNKQEAGLLKQSLMSLRMAFVEAVNAPGTGPAGTKAESAPAPTETPAAAATPSQPSAAPQEEEHRKKFSKKY